MTLPDDDHVPSVTLHEAAELLGVHYMTAYRYVRTGRLPAVKEGAEWRVSPADLRAFEAASAARLAAPVEPGRRGARRHGPGYHRRLEGRLLAGDEAGAWTILEDAMTAGVEPDELYLEVLAPAMASIGDGWAAGEISVGEEHRASVVMLRLIGRLGPRFTRRGRKRGSIVVGAAPGDHHGVPVALAADLLRGEGFTVVDLGADTPAVSFVEAARDAERLVAVGINATSAGNEASIAATIAGIRRELDCPVVLGGSGLTDPVAAQALGADVVTTTAAEAIAAFNLLAEQRPRRHA
jgi:excisionase family DNA binding protein